MEMKKSDVHLYKLYLEKLYLTFEYQDMLDVRKDCYSKDKQRHGLIQYLDWF